MKSHYELCCNFSTFFSALHNLYFAENRDTALSSFRLLNSIGWGISFGYSNWLCSKVKIYVLIVILLLSLSTFVYLDVKHKRTMGRNRRQEDNEKDAVKKDLIGNKTITQTEFDDI